MRSGSASAIMVTDLASPPLPLLCAPPGSRDGAFYTVPQPIPLALFLLLPHAPTLFLFAILARADDAARCSRACRSTTIRRLPAVLHRCLLPVVCTRAPWPDFLHVENHATRCRLLYGRRLPIPPQVRCGTCSLLFPLPRYPPPGYVPAGDGKTTYDCTVPHQDAAFAPFPANLLGGSVGFATYSRCPRAVQALRLCTCYCAVLTGRYGRTSFTFCTYYPPPPPTPPTLPLDATTPHPTPAYTAYTALPTLHPHPTHTHTHTTLGPS